MRNTRFCIGRNQSFVCILFTEETDSNKMAFTKKYNKETMHSLNQFTAN